MELLRPHAGSLKSILESDGRCQKHRSFDVLTIGGPLVGKLKHAHDKTPDIHCQCCQSVMFSKVLHYFITCLHNNEYSYTHTHSLSHTFSQRRPEDV